MPRPLRVTRPNTVYHLISRFVAREWFIRTDQDRQVYLQLLGRALGTTDWRCFSYAIMSSHIHLGLLSGEMVLADWLREAHSPFAEWINELRNGRIGAVFARGPNLHEVRPDGVGRVISYIHRNPVRAGVVLQPSDNDWTSHRAYAGTSAPPPWLDVELGARLAGYRDPKDLAAWIDAVAVDRSDVEAVTVREVDMFEGTVSDAAMHEGFASDGFKRAESETDGFERSDSEADKCERSESEADGFESESEADNFERSESETDGFERSDSEADNCERSGSETDVVRDSESEADNFERSEADDFESESEADGFESESGAQRSASEADDFQRSESEANGYEPRIRSNRYRIPVDSAA